MPFDPASHVQVDFQGCTITQNLRPILREKILLPEFRRYCEQRMEWSSTTFDVINWDLFRPIYRKQAKKNLQWINKLCLRNLPTGHQLNKINNCEITKCCSCGANVEDDDHLFQCTKRPNFLKSIRQALKKYRDKLNPKLYQLLYDGIYTYVKGTTLPFIRTCLVLSQKGPATLSHYPTPYHQKFTTTYIE